MAKPRPERSNGIYSRTIPGAVIGLGIISGAIYRYNFRLSGLIPEFLRQNHIHVYLFLFGLLYAAYLAAVGLILKNRGVLGNSKSLLAVIFLFAIAFRLFLIPANSTVLSTDIYRYIWDGRVQHRGINPYRYPPAAEELKPLRDDRIFPDINRKDFRTIYPAGAQLFFRVSYALAQDSVSGHKGIMVFFDVLTLLLLTGLLRQYGFETARLVIYAWNPLVIFEIACSGHLEGVTVFLVVAALYLNALRKKTAGIVFVTLAGAVKLYPALLLAAFLNRGDRLKGAGVFLAVFGLLYLPYLAAGRSLPGFLPVYLHNPYESFNLGLKHLCMYLFPGLGYQLLSQLFILVLLAAGLAVFLKAKPGIEVLHRTYFLAGWLLIWMPAALHPWYVVLIIPFLAFYPSAAWLLFAGTVALSYLKYVSPRGIMPGWVLPAEYLPLFVLLAAGFIRKRFFGRGRSSGGVSSGSAGAPMAGVLE